MGTHDISKAVGPFDKYTEVLVEKIGTVGVPANTVVSFVQDDDTGKVEVVHTAKSVKVEKAVKKTTTAKKKTAKK